MKVRSIKLELTNKKMITSITIQHLTQDDHITLWKLQLSLYKNGKPIYILRELEVHIHVTWKWNVIILHWNWVTHISIRWITYIQYISCFISVSLYKHLEKRMCIMITCYHGPCLHQMRFRLRPINMRIHFHQWKEVVEDIKGTRANTW